MNKTLITVLVIAVLAIGAYLYVTRAPSAPSQDITDFNATSSIAGTYNIVASESMVKFEVGEILNGSPFTAVGTTTQIAGTITVDADSVSLGTIRINARTFKTDNDRRDGAIARAILRSEAAANEFIVFEPTSVQGPARPLASTAQKFTVSGNLTIAGVTKPATFSIDAAIVNGTVIGTATTVVSRSDYGLVIPSVPFVASVDDEVKISADIVAR
ncbi:MAG: YceI family protein [bacterium]|nr:YceI family protein [bacterium]